LGRKPTLVLQAPVDTRKFNPEIVKPDASLCGLPGLRIVTIGNTTPLKGLEYFIEMAAVLNLRYESLQFLIVGDILESQRQYVRKLKELISTQHLHNVHLLGLSNNIPGILKGTDIYVCASIYEASPTALWEAMAMAKPVVATDVGDVSKFVEIDKSGYVVPARNPEQLARHVGLLIESAALRERFGLAARRKAVQYLDALQCVERQVLFYRELMGIKDQRKESRLKSIRGY